MNAKHKVMLGSLAGALVIHVALAACSKDIGQALDGGALDGLFGDDRMFGSDTANADTDAGADGGTNSEGGCGCTVQLQGPINSVTADTDSAQLLSGRHFAGPNPAGVEKIVDGPFVLTDATVGLGTGPNWGNGWGYSTQLTVETSAGSCAGNGAVLEQVGSTTQNGSTGNAMHGGRYLIPSGKMLCAYGNLIWAGFKPYK